MPNELKPCPFCGSDNLSIIQHGGGDNRSYYAKCNDCNSHGPWVLPLSRTGAINIWDTRPNQEDLAEATDIIQRVYLYQKTKRSHTRPVEDMPTNQELETYLNKGGG